MQSYRISNHGSYLSVILHQDFSGNRAEVVFRDRMGSTTTWYVPRDGEPKVSSRFRDGLTTEAAPALGAVYGLRELFHSLQHRVPGDWYKRLDSALPR